MNHPLVFDLDGTLVDSLGSVAQAINVVLVQEGLQPLTLDETRRHVGEGAVHMLTGILHERGLNPDTSAISRCVEYYVAAYLRDPASHTTVFPGVVEVLSELARQKVIMGVCTNKPGTLANAVLERFDLKKFFCAVVSPDETAHRKPDGRHIQATLEQMRANRTAAIVVGDSESDILAGKAAGLKTVLVTYGYRKGRTAEEHASAIIDRFGDLPGVLKRLAS